ncbi:MAG TPA: MG2 domain-containing protein, partial [Steroidobacteraceae bacterium]
MATSGGWGFRLRIVRLWRAWARMAQALLGTWQWDAPRWAIAAKSAAVHGAAATVAIARRRPRSFAAGVMSVLVLMAAGAVLWHEYRHWPKPESAAFTVTPPERTRIERDGAKPEPLIVRFDRSVAPLALAGKPLLGGITLHPALAGTWRWLDDRVLEFRVKDDWPVGQRFDVTLDKAVLAPQFRLESYTFEFAAASFAARLANAEFYQDPVNPGVKFAVFDLEFTHPVDAAELERRVELRLAGQKEGVLGVGRETIGFNVVYDKWKLHASIHSASLAVPKNPTTLELKVAAGVRAARGGNPSAAPLTASASVPGLYSLSIEGVEPMVVANARNEPEQVLLLNVSAATGERDVACAVKAWVLPAVRAADAITPARGSPAAPYYWSDPQEVSEAVLGQARPLALEPIAAEREFVESHSFRYRAEVGSFVLVQVDKNLRSFGGYLAARTERFIVRVPPFPPALKILSQGAVLALSGDHKVAALVRDLPGVRVDIARVLPAQLQHWVSQSGGDFANPTFTGNFGPDNLTERTSHKIPLGNLGHGQNHFETIDFSEYLKSGGSDKHGVFLLTLRGYDPRVAPHDADDNDAMSDARLVLVTDLGIVLKRAADGTQDVFVQSIASGLPVAGASVDIIAKNGTTLLSHPTDADGRAHFLKMENLTRERTPLLVQVQKAGDFSFLPLNHADRNLDYSRFDVGGVHSARTATQLSAYLFCDRGIYRPGDTLHVGMIAKTALGSAELAGIPLEAEILDARGLTALRQRFKLPGSGFTELSHTLPDTAPTGAYSVNLYIVKDDRPDAEIGTTTLRVQEFEPDRMKVSAHLSAESLEGWVSPQDLKATVNVANLFGTAAQQRR